ncbi:uncharacterized protein LOC18026851 [Eutrema salsugineum]|uniref:uncharacterized protein LOC18026851 n=1 Tax=Eutrema salsugineum TaxID=72664 RepID=UPI000CECFAED|nr:uncharacterized protein LOC18026851 [Eutrema salsugineum]
MYEEILQDLSCQLTIAHREKHESSERLRQSLLQIAKLEKLVNNILLSGQQQVPPYYYTEAIDETNRLQNCNYIHFSGDSPSGFSIASPLDNFVSSPPGENDSPAISDSASYGSSSNQMGFDVHNRRDFETVVLEIIGGVLPENGKFFHSVSEAGQLLQSLLVTGPVPKWINPPV